MRKKFGFDPSKNIYQILLGSLYRMSADEDNIVFWVAQRGLFIPLTSLLDCAAIPTCPRVAAFLGKGIL